MNTRAVQISISVTTKTELRPSHLTLGPDEFLSAGQLAYALRIPGRTLAEWRHRDKWIPFIRIEGRPRYRRKDVLTWLEMRKRDVVALEQFEFEDVGAGK